MQTIAIITTLFAAMAAALPQGQFAPPYGASGPAPAGYYADEEYFCLNPALVCCKEAAKGTSQDFDFARSCETAKVGAGNAVVFGFCQAGTYPLCCKTVGGTAGEAHDCNYAFGIRAPGA